ncbi:MAG: MFS transporter, partial [Desulfarculaceae bacterium]
MTSSGSTSSHLIRNTIGGAFGNILEWYDFAVFGYFAPVIGANFFPAQDKLAALINAFGVFAAGYLMRPIGGIIFGHIGDRLGRKRALQLSVALMAIPTTLLGLLPSYASIGVTASVLLVVLRLVQGLSVGGELIGSISFITEMAPARRRGFLGSWTLFSAIGGVMLGSAVATLLHWVLSDASLHSWGWRLPFLAGILIGGFGLWMRSGIKETPAFEQARRQGQVISNPVVEAVRT